LGIGDIASLLGITVDSLPSDRRQLETLAELTEALLEKNGDEWLRQNGDVDTGAMGDDAQAGDIEREGKRDVKPVEASGVNGRAQAGK
jgi:hypothetical protein